jgi:hypothetical protein
MDISSNINLQVINGNTQLVNQSDGQKAVNLLKVVDATTKEAQLTLNTLQQAQSSADEPTGSWGMANAAVKAVMGMFRRVPTVWRVPLPFSTPTNVPVTTQPPANQGSPAPSGQVARTEAPPPSGSQAQVSSAPAATHSLLPPWAKIFENAGTSEWRPGGASENAYVWLRKELKGDIDKIQVLSPDGTKVIATGSLGKVASDGRTRFNFDKKSGEVPSGAIVMATLKNNGGVRYIEIDKPNRAFKW